MTRSYCISLLALACLGLPSCASEEEGATEPTAKPVAANVPDNIRLAASREIGSICTLDSINGERPRVGTTFPPGVTARFQGWARVADRNQPVPPVVYLVLRPEGVSAGDQDVYLEMGRMPRPDQSGSDPATEMIGFEGQAKLPAEGVYEAWVWQGAADSGSLCKISQPIIVEQPDDPVRTLVPVMEDEQAEVAPQ